MSALELPSGEKSKIDDKKKKKHAHAAARVHTERQIDARTRVRRREKILGGWSGTEQRRRRKEWSDVNNLEVAV